MNNMMTTNLNGYNNNLSFPPGRETPNIASSQHIDQESRIEQQLNNAFDAVLNNGNVTPLVELSNQCFPALVSKLSESRNLQQNRCAKQPALGLYTIGNNMAAGASVVMKAQARFHIGYNGERLTLDEQDWLPAMDALPTNSRPWCQWMAPKPDQSNPDQSKPALQAWPHFPNDTWSQWNDPQKQHGYTLDEIGRIIFGVRFCDPVPQSQWKNQNILGQEAWPDRNTTWSGRNTFAGDGSNTILMDQASRPTAGAAYGITPRAVVHLKSNNSILMTCQIENRGAKRDNKGQPYRWGSWAVLPFKLFGQGTAQDPSELVVFPGDLTNPGQSSRWRQTSLDGKNIVTLNPYVPPQNADDQKRCFEKTNVAILARKGMDYVMVMRTPLQHPDQFQVYSGQPQYVELEATGPLVGKGEKSTALIQLDFTPLNKLSGLNFTRFSTSGREFQGQVTNVLRQLLRAS